jgi:hypothetical protein
MKDHTAMEGRNILLGLLALALPAFLFGFIASPAMALSITSTYTEVVSASLGTPSPIMEAGRLGGQLGSSLVAGFPKATVLGNSFWPAMPSFDDGGIKAMGAPVGTGGALTGTHRFDVFFADAWVRQSWTEPAPLLLFGGTLVGLGLIVRRRMRGAAKHNA